MGNLDAGISPQRWARVAGALYVVIVAIGVFGEAVVRDRLVVSGDAVATAERIRGSETLWRLSVAGELFYLALAVIVAFAMYLLLRPVDRGLALLATLFNGVSIAIEAVNRQHLLAALFPLADAEFLSPLEPAQRAALSYLSIRAHTYGFGVSLIFFGCVCVVWGILIARSGFLPKAIGLLMQLAGACYLVNSFALIVAPAFASRLFPAILLPPFIAETALALWLLVKGVDVARWEARAASAPAR